MYLSDNSFVVKKKIMIHITTNIAFYVNTKITQAIVKPNKQRKINSGKNLTQPP